MEAELELLCFPDQHNSMVSREYGKRNCFLITRLAPYITALKDDALRPIQGKKVLTPQRWLELCNCIERNAGLLRIKGKTAGLPKEEMSLCSPVFIDTGARKAES